MNKIVRLALPILFILTFAHAQQEPDNRGANRFAASVSELKGACLVRDNETAKSRRLKPHDKLQVDQQLQCEAKAYLKIRFRSGGGDAVITAIDPKWYQVPNVPGSAAKESGPKRAGGAKGNDPPLATPTPGTLSPQQPTVQASGSGELDEADLFWKSRQKYFLIVAATKTAGASSDLPFTKVDAQRISQALTKLGYQKLQLLSDELATHDNFVAELKKIRNLPSNALVIVYYSGHAVTDPQGKDLWLQLYGQQLGDQFGLSVSGIVDSARGTTYKGGLAIILDTCYSGRGTSNQLSLREIENTIIFASSASYQPSYSKVLPSGVEMSAFTYYLLEGLESDWAQVDGDADGIILYSDLQIYVGTKLLQQLRGRAILGPMEPQLFVKSSKGWAAYDRQKASNFESPQRKILRQERTFDVQDPEEVAKLLPTPLPPGAHAYQRALNAIGEEEFDEAWGLLEKAEKEQRVSLTEIYWARGYVKIARKEFSGARDWLEKALALSERQNVDLLGLTAGMNFAAGNLARAEQQFKQVIGLLSDENEDKPEMIGSFMGLAALKALSGNTIEAEQYLARLRRFDPKVLEEQEEGLSQVVPLLEILLDFVRGKNEKASRRLAELRQTLISEKGEMLEAFRPFLHIADLALNTRDADASKIASLLNDVFKQWEEAIQERKVNDILRLLNQLQVIAGGSADMKLLRTNDVETRLRRTVDLARQHKSERQKITIEGVGEAEIANSEEQSAIESANLLTGVAIVYAVRREVQEAEKLFKEAISLEQQNTGSAYQDLNSIMRLAELYEDSGRRGEAENVYKKALTQHGARWGEQSWQALSIQQELGKLSESRGKWDEAEQIYEFVARLSQSAFGADSIGAIGAQETLATFLFQRGRYAEAIPMFEPVVRWFERKGQTEPWLVEVSTLKDAYFQLAKSYYKVGRYDEAESAFRKGSDLVSASEDADLLRKSACLVWQWFAADALKKPEEAKRLYHDLIQLIQLDLAQPHPNKFIGGNLQDFASWFGDAEEYAKADELLRLALAVQEKAYGARTLETGYVWTHLGDLDISRGQYRSAIVSLKNAQSISEKQSPAPMFWLSYVQYKIGLANYSQLDFEEARLHLTRSAELLQQARDSDNFARRQLGRVERLLGHLEAAKESMKSVLHEREKAKPPDPSGIFFALLELTSISRLQGDREDANQWLARAQKASEGVDPVEISVRWSLFDYEKGMAAFGKGRTKEAAELLRVAIDKGERTLQMDQPLLIEYLEDYAKVMRQRGKNKEAVLIEQQAKQIRDRLKSEK